METLEVTGRSVEEAIEIALSQLGAERDQVEVDVLSPGKGGILGFGAEPARIRVTLTIAPTGLVTVARLTVDNLIRGMKVSASSSVRSESVEEEDTVQIDLEGEDSGLLIGRRGETLRALQFIVNLVVSRKASGRVILDVEGYKDRRYASLRSLATRVAERVASTGRAITLEPMAPNERRIVHLALADHPSVATESTGVGEERRITIMPKEK
ncbi:MAG: protein jag [Chloroflexi bacterium]|nr:protein jag [Chloroflexota bacterium]